MTRQRVLVIDDDKDLVSLISLHLRAAGFQVLAAYDAMQGLMFAQRERPAAIITDLGMPAGGGMSLCERLGTLASTSEIPVIVITGSTDPALEREVRSRGAVGFLTKPLEREQLLELVRHALSRV